MPPAMSCKTSKNNQNWATGGKSNKIKSKLACILEASESTRLRMGESLPKYHEDHIAGKGDNSLQHCNSVHKFIPMPQAMEIPDAKAAVDKEWEKHETIPAWQLDKVKSKNGEEEGWSFWTDKETTRKSTSPHWWTSVISRKIGVRTNIPEVQRKCRAPRWHCKRRLWSLTQFLLNRARLRPRWLPQKSWMLSKDNQIVMDKQLTPCQMEDAPRIPKSECPKKWTRFPRIMAKIVGKLKNPLLFEHSQCLSWWSECGSIV